jgi:hypothetical protein
MAGGALDAHWHMIPKNGNRFPACVKPLAHFLVWVDASAGEAGSEKVMRQQKLRAG